ncbi:hypothetical protein HaLaN_20622, partial [Haematococcus lacustris]
MLPRNPTRIEIKPSDKEEARLQLCTAACSRSPRANMLPTIMSRSGHSLSSCAHRAEQAVAAPPMEV